MKSNPEKPRPYAQTARAQAAEATGTRIVDAFVDRLMAGWFDEITLDAVAADSGVTVQTVIRRFGSKDGLLAAACRALGERIEARRATPPGDVDRALKLLLDDYATTGDPILRLLALEQRHPALSAFLNYGRASHRNWIASTFAPLLNHLPPAARQRAVDALVIATDVYTWKLLHRDMARTRPETLATMKQLVSAVLAGVQST